MIVKTDAIVLNSMRFGDTSKIVWVYTKEYGKVSIIAKGAVSLKNKYGGSLEPLSYISLIFYKKYNINTLQTLKETDLIIPFNNIFANYIGLICGRICCEFLKNTQPDNLQSIEIFELTKDYLILLNKNIYNEFVLSTIFLFRLAEYTGFNVDFSFIEDLPIEPSNKLLNLSLDNLAPEYIQKSNSGSFGLPTNILFKLSNFNNLSFDNIPLDINFEINEFKDIVNFFSKYFEYHLNNAIKIKYIDLLV